MQTLYTIIILVMHCLGMSELFAIVDGRLGWLNGPYSLLVRASYFISFSVHARFASAIFTICKWRWWCRNILVVRISVVFWQRINLKTRQTMYHAF